MKNSDRTPAAVFILEHPTKAFRTIGPRRNNPATDSIKSTYSLLVRSEEKGRSVFEALIYVFLIWGPLVAMAQFAEYRIVIPAGGLF